MFRVFLTIFAIGVSIAVADEISGASPGVDQGEMVRIATSGPRALSDALLELARRTGWLITYEDPPWLNPADRVVRPKPERREKDLPTTYVVRDGIIDFDFRVIAASVSQAEELRTLQALLANSASHLNAGVFDVHFSGGAFHVVPMSMSDGNGRARPYSSPLDTILSIPRVEIDGLDAVGLIADAITAKSGRKILIGAGPLGVMGRSKINLGADGETARSVLLRTLRAMSSPLTWHLYCQPGIDECYLNFLLLSRRMG